MSMILQTTDLLKSFHGQTAVSRICLHIEKNTVYGLLAPNGAGKSTTLKMIAGILKPTAGSISFDGHAWTRSDLNHIGALIETPPLYENLTARENLKVKATLLGLPDSRITEVLQTVRLTDTVRKRAGQLSLGMNYFKSEHLKFKRSAINRLAFLLPLLTAVFAWVVGGFTGFPYTAFYWWYAFLLPGTIAILCSLSHRKEENAGKYYSVCNDTKSGQLSANLCHGRGERFHAGGALPCAGTIFYGGEKPDFQSPLWHGAFYHRQHPPAA